jgi:hypothetical protein
VNERQVSWLLIEPGWAVVATDGSEIGYVDEVVGDDGADIFDGLAISSGLFENPRYLPSEKVGRIFEGKVELRVDSNDLQRLDDFLEPPPSLDIGADKPSWSDRVLEEVASVDSKPKSVSLGKRIVPWLRSILRR